MPTAGRSSQTTSNRPSQTASIVSNGRTQARIDEYVRATCLDVPEPPPPRPVRQRTRRDPSSISIARASRRSCAQTASARRSNGRAADLRRARIPSSHTGRRHRIPGLAFIGLPWLYRRRSPLLLSVGADAEHIATENRLAGHRHGKLPDLFNRLRGGHVRDPRPVSDRRQPVAARSGISTDSTCREFPVTGPPVL